MNDGSDIIVVRNPPNKKKAILSTTQQPIYMDDNEFNPDIDFDLSESMRRQRQIEYAEELRQQILQKKALEDQINNPQQRVFMASLGSLYGDQSIEIERKRRQQEKLAESLRQQIEEKRRAREIEKQKEAAREASYYSTPNSNDIPNTSASTTSSEQSLSNNFNFNISNANSNTTSNCYVHQARKLKFQTQPVSKAPYKTLTQNHPPKPLNDFDNNNESNFSKTAPFAPIPHLTFEISSESPFSHSTVKTPPLGFSLRRDHLSSLSITAPIHHNDPPLITVQNNNFSKSALSQHKMPLQQSHPNRMLNSNYINNSNTNNSVNKYDHQINLNVRSDDIPMRLGTVSELVYPDGHISPITSPH